MSFSPTSTELLIQPSVTAQNTYTLVNSGDPTTFIVTVLPFEARDTVGRSRILPKLEGPIQFESDELSEIKLNEPFFLRNTEKKTLRLNIRVNEGAPLKDYYYMLVAQSQPPPTEEGSSSLKAKITLTSPLLIMVSQSGEVHVKPKMALFEILPKYKIIGLNIFDSQDHIPVVLVMNNEGNNFIKARGTISIKGPLGRTVSFEIKPQNILAESQRLLKGDPSPYQDNLSLLLSGFFLGRYTVSTSISFGEGTPVLTSSTSFLAIPLTFLIILGSVCIVFFVFRKRIIKKRSQAGEVS